MGDPGGRAVVVVAIACAALAVGLLWRRGRAWVRHRRPLPGLADGVYLFTAQTCSSCSTVRARLLALGAPHVEIAYEEDPTVFEAIGISRVPALAKVSGSETWVAFGDPGAGAIRRWLGGP